MKSKLYFDQYLLKLSFVSIVFLLIFGIFLVSSATAVESQRIYSDSFYMIKNHLLAVLIGIFVFFVIKKINYLQIIYFTNPLILSMIIVLFFLFTYGDNVFGSSRWLDLGFIRIQPSELAKPIIMLWTAKQLSNNAINQKDIHRVWKAIFLPGIATVLIFLQPDFGTAATVAFIVLIQIMFSKVKLVYPLIISFVGSLIASIFVTSEFYRVERLRVWSERICDQGQELLGACFQVHQSRIAISSGGMFGLGPGTSRARWGSLPSAYSDFISAIIGEEYGFIGYIIFIFILSVLLLSIFIIAIREKNEFKRIFISGLGAWILFQSILNLGASVYLLPITGIVLPFVSYGGTAMVSLFIALGIMYSKVYE
tara:strand:- start:7733 stop:8836 length:1104 start_codon:yes stop_codon:yes gene_type:complete